MKRENISTRHPIFCRMQEDFTEGINDALKRMLRNGVNEGRVTCTLDINLFEDEVTGTHGIERLAKTPVFQHKVKTSVSQGVLLNGKTNMRGTEITQDSEGNPVLSEYSRQMTLFDEGSPEDDEE